MSLLDRIIPKSAVTEVGRVYWRKAVEERFLPEPPREPEEGFQGRGGAAALFHSSAAVLGAAEERASRLMGMLTDEMGWTFWEGEWFLDPPRVRDLFPTVRVSAEPITYGRSMIGRFKR